MADRDRDSMLVHFDRNEIHRFSNHLTSGPLGPGSPRVPLAPGFP